MVKQLSINCNFRNGGVVPMNFYVGNPSDEYHPIHFQTRWLSEKKGGSVPEEILDSFDELQKIAIANNIAFEDLCEFAIEEVKNNLLILEERKRLNKNLNIINEIEKKKKLPQSAQAANTQYVAAQQKTPSLPPKQPLQNTLPPKQPQQFGAQISQQKSPLGAQIPQQRATSNAQIPAQRTTPPMPQYQQPQANRRGVAPSTAQQKQAPDRAQPTQHIIQNQFTNNNEE